jgi:tyrosine-protein kinase Etk/Wzc
MTDFNSNQTSEIPQSSSFDIKHWALRILHLWPWFIVSISICVTIAYFYLRYTPPTYKAIASVLIKQGPENPLMAELGLGGAPKILGNEVEVLKSFDLMQEVVKKSQLYLTVRNQGRIGDRIVYGNDIPFVWEFANPDTLQRALKWQLYWEDNKWMLQVKPESEKSVAINLVMGQWYTKGGLKFRLWPNINSKSPKAGSEENHKYEILVLPLDAATSLAQGSIEILPVNKLSTILGLSFVDKHPLRAKVALANIINLYDQEGLEDKNRSASSTVDFLTARLEAVEKDLRGVEGQVEQYKTKNQITDLSSNAQQYLSMSTNIDAQKAQHESKVGVVDMLEKELVLNQENPRLMPSTMGIAEPSLGSLISRHNDLVLQKDRVQQKAGSKNPLLVDLESQIKDVRNSMIENVRNLRTAYDMELEDIKRKDNQLSSRIRNIPQIEKNLLQITRDQTVKMTLHTFLLQKREEAAVSLASAVPDIRNIDKARAIGQIAPVPSAVWFMAFLFGWLLPILGLVIIELMDNKVGNMKEVQKKTVAPLLGEISYIKKLESPIPVSKGGRSIVAEQFRTLRTAITYTGKGRNVIMVTSHRPGEGKSFTSTNLAASYALLNKKVIILEFDLRKPGISKNLGLKPTIGISSYLAGEATLDEAILPITGHDSGNLFLLPAGPLPPNPAELILSSQMELLIAELKERFDFIIIDTPPFSVVTDANLLQQYADASIVVLRQGYTFREVYEILNTRIIQYPEKPLYTILNGIGRTAKYNSSSYGYGYGQGYGYGGGYFESDKKKPFYKRDSVDNA